MKIGGETRVHGPESILKGAGIDPSSVNYGRESTYESMGGYNFFKDISSDTPKAARRLHDELTGIYKSDEDKDNSALKFLEDIGKMMIITLELAIMATFSAVGCIVLMIGPVLSEGVLEEGARRAAGISPEIV